MCERVHCLCCAGRNVTWRPGNPFLQMRGRRASSGISRRPLADPAWPGLSTSAAACLQHGGGRRRSRNEGGAAAARWASSARRCRSQGPPRRSAERSCSSCRRWIEGLGLQGMLPGSRRWPAVRRGCSELPASSGARRSRQVLRSRQLQAAPGAHAVCRRCDQDPAVWRVPWQADEGLKNARPTAAVCLPVADVMRQQVRTKQSLLVASEGCCGKARKASIKAGAKRLAAARCGPGGATPSGAVEHARMALPAAWLAVMSKNWRCAGNARAAGIGAWGLARLQQGQPLNDCGD